MHNNNINKNKYHGINFKNINNNNQSFLCNFKKQNTQNKTILNRYINCNNPPNLLLSSRPEFNTCNKPNTEPYKLPKIKLPNCCNMNCIGDRGDPLGYLSSIDVESDILNINRKLNNCRNIEYKQEIDCKNCDKYCCNKIENNINLHEINYRNPNKCIKFEKPKKCKSNISTARSFDTLYNYSNSNECFDCEPLWNARSKRKYLDPVKCEKSKYELPPKDCPKPCLGNYPDISKLLKNNRNKDFNYCPSMN